MVSIVLQSYFSLWLVKEFEHFKVELTQEVRWDTIFSKSDGSKSKFNLLNEASEMHKS